MSTSIQYHDVSRETWERHRSLIQSHRRKLTEYLEQLLWWNRKVNLVSRNTDRLEIWKHIGHSLLPLSLNLFSGDHAILDAGTGGGLPGIPLAIVAPEHYFTLNDTNFKKITAVHQITESLNIENVTLRRGSYQNLEMNGPYVFISKHSFKIPPLIDYLHQHEHCRQLVIYKGSDFDKEVGRVEKSLNIRAYRLHPHQPDSFYSNKYILQISRDS